MDELVNGFNTMNISTNTPQQETTPSIIRMVRADIDLILRAYHSQAEDLPHPLYAPFHMMNNPATRRLFFDIFPSERELYYWMMSIIRDRLSVIFDIELMPLVDNYIEMIFAWRHQE